MKKRYAFSLLVVTAFMIALLGGAVQTRPAAAASPCDPYGCDSDISVTYGAPGPSYTLAFSGAVATFTDADDDGDTAASFAATIGWGDGTTTGGTVTGPDGGPYTVSGSHAYARPARYTLTVVAIEETSERNFATGPLNIVLLTYYTWDTNNGTATGDTTHYMCAGGPGICPGGSTPTGVPHDSSLQVFTVHVWVSNLTGLAITDMVTGGIAPGVTFVGSSSSLSGCSSSMSKTSASSSPPNFISWNLSRIADGTYCELVIRITARWSSAGTKSLTTAWTEARRALVPGAPTSISTNEGPLEVVILP